MLAYGLVLALAAHASAQAADSPPPFDNSVARHYAKELSFRGVAEGGRIDGFDISGHASAVPGVLDYLKLVPATPLAHGALFSTKALTSAEWIVEMAFRMHGAVDTGLEDETSRGGRGLAFWYSKTGNPGPITIASDPKKKTFPPPPLIPDHHADPTDNDVSLFGARTTFDGLGILFDATPYHAVRARSDSRGWGRGKATHAMGSGVVSGILDDGTGHWLDPVDREMGPNDEAAYFEKTIGECDAAFRNAQGLLWVRISFINQTIRVDVDLAPHTTLAKAGRDYAHNCFSLSGVNLAPGSFVGITGMASGNAEPDSVDVYAMDVFEVLKGVKVPVIDVDEPVEPPRSAPLEGTTEDPVTTLAQEIFLSQAKMLQAIDALSHRVELLAMSLVSSHVTSTTNSLEDSVRLTKMEGTLAELLKIPGGRAALTSIAGDKAESESYTHILQIQERLMVELKSFGRKLEASNGASGATLATLASRNSEILSLLQRANVALDSHTTTLNKGLPWLWILLGLGGVGAAVGMALKSRGEHRGRKMI